MTARTLGDSEIYSRLRSLLVRFEPQLTVLKDEPGNYSLESDVLDSKGRPLWFGGVQIKKQYVSYHLMPVYFYPELLEDMSDKLRSRMQGKSCFNFKRVDETLFAELAALTEQSFMRLLTPTTQSAPSERV